MIIAQRELVAHYSNNAAMTLDALWAPGGRRNLVLRFIEFDAPFDMQSIEYLHEIRLIVMFCPTHELFSIDGASFEAAKTST
jgi:hypothetical protein